MRRLSCLIAVLVPLSLSCKEDPPPPPPECGNGLLETDETCEGMPPPVGCDPDTCTVDAGWFCLPEVPSGGADGTGGGPTLPAEWDSTCEMIDTCGDGVIDPGEACDDDNDIPGDGCSGCVVDPLYTCTGMPSDCHKCGDGFVNTEVGEECDSGLDLGNASPGCTENCDIVDGWECFGEPTLCGPICGDGMWFDTSIPDVTIGFAEECDDGNTEPGDGCDENCLIEDPYECTGSPPGISTCAIPPETSTGPESSSGGSTGGSTGGSGTGGSGGSGTAGGSGSGSAGGVTSVGSG